MAQARITVNGTLGSDGDLPINTVVQLDNQNSGGELTYTWSILDQPPGAADALSAVASQNPFFTPRKEGSYLIKLIVNQGLPSEQEDRVICAVLQLKTGERIPAAGETTEMDTSDGWATASNSMLRRMDTLLGDPGIFIGVNASGGSLARGDILRATASSIIKSGLPGQETVPGLSKALASSLLQVDEPLVICEGTITGGASVPNGQIMKVRFLGRYAAITGAGTAAVGDPVFVSDTGVPSLTPGTIRRQVGSAMSAGATFDIWFAGIGGAEITPITPAYMLYSDPDTLPNAHRFDGSNATPGASGGLAYRFKAGDISTVAMEVQGFSGSTENLQNWLDSSGTTLLAVGAGGELLYPDWKISQSSTLLRIERTSGTGGTGVKNKLELSSVTYDGLPAAQAELGLDLSPFRSALLIIQQGKMVIGTSTNLSVRVLIGGVETWIFNTSPTYHLVAPTGATVINLPAPRSAASDAVPKGYADAIIQNLIINGDFNIWQRGTTVTLNPGDRTYLADRWYVGANNVGSNTIVYSQQTITPGPTRFVYAARVARPNGQTVAEARALAQEIDRDFLRLNRSYRAHVSFWCRVGANFSGTFAAQVVTPTNSVGAAEDNAFTGYTSGNLLDSVAITPTTSWVKYTAAFTGLQSFTGLCAAFRFLHTPTGTAGANDWFEVAGVQLLAFDANNLPAAGNFADAAPPYIYAGGSHAGELALCESYYEKSSDYPYPITDPGSLTTVGTLLRIMHDPPSNMFVEFRVRKRKIPAVRIANGSSGSLNSAFGTVSSSQATTIGSTTAVNFGFSLAAAVAGEAFYFRFDADAEI